MANVFWKNLHLCCFSSNPKPSESESSQSLIPLLPNQDSDNYTHQPPAAAAAAAAAAAVVLKNLNSHYNFSSSTSTSTSKSLLTPSTDNDLLSSDSDTDNESPPDFATLFASQRFFFSSPGQSNSIVESPDTRPRDSIEIPPLDGGVAVKKFSMDPYRDFLCSMQEMIEARNVRDIRSHCEFLHELLFCYLVLNPKQNHKFIIRAFTDIVISLFSSPDSDTLQRPEGYRR
ncbi:hypothetical protein SLA2020_330930 [Shorea laevis]